MFKNSLLIALSLFTSTIAFASFWDGNSKDSVSALSQSQKNKTPSSEPSSTYREMSYDDLIQEYNSTRSQRATLEKKRSLSQKNSRAFGGYFLSFANYQMDEEALQTTHQGFSIDYAKEFQPQISWGIQYKNLPSVKIRNIRIEANEIDTMIHYTSDFDDHTSAQLSTGIASRILNIEQNQETSSNMSLQFLIGAGIYYRPSNEWLVGFEPQAKSALLTRTADRTAFDLNIKVGAKF